MKQFCALLLFLLCFVPFVGGASVLSNLEENTCDAFKGYKAEVTIVSQPTKCKQPYGGELTATLKNATGKEATGNYQYAWYNADNPTTRIAVGAKFDKVGPGTYFVVITDTKTDCTFRSGTVTLNQPEKPWFEVVYLENVIGCNAEPYGRILLRSENRWKARWYRGDQVEESNGISKYQSLDRFENLPPGTYTVIYEDVDSGCFSDPFTFTIEGWPITPIVNATIVADTSCTTGTGSLTLTASTPAPGTEPEFGYMYKWFGPDGTELSQFANKSTASPLKAGTYTVVVTGDYSNDNFQ